MSEPIPHSRPTLGPEEAAAARRVLLSGQVAQGPEVAAFEAEVARLTGRRHAVAVSSGTAALHLALRALGLGPGDEVLAPSYVCSALVHAAAAVGARTVLFDAEPATRNPDPADAARRRTPRCRATIVPHMFGLPARVQAFARLEVPVIEDCAMCLGTQAGGAPVGSAGELAVCSFFASKVLTSAGEGGMVLTDSEALAEQVRSGREYDHLPASTPRYNYKMTEMAAAVGRIQLRRLPEFVRRRRELARRYDAGLEATGLALPPRGEGHIYYRYVVAAEGGAESLVAALGTLGVAAARPVYAPMHRELGLADGEYPRAARAWADDVSLPIYPLLTDAEAERVVAALRRTLGA
ncbi:MAG: DegT/DnrJ/EryC1/StrS aminotransferase family protein [Gemmatimonadota bacterium]